jgi:hypothetical protein
LEDHENPRCVTSWPALIARKKIHGSRIEPPRLSTARLERRQQPKSNASVDRTKVFDSLGTEPVHLNTVHRENEARRGWTT